VGRFDGSDEDGWSCRAAWRRARCIKAADGAVAAYCVSVTLQACDVDLTMAGYAVNFLHPQRPLV